MILLPAGRRLPLRFRPRSRLRLRPHFPALSAPTPIPMAHRGGGWEAPENSGEAFQRAYDMGYRYLETDARATKDGVALAFHDAHLDRVTDTEALIRDTTWAQARRAQIHGHAEILRLDDLIMSFPDAVFNIDVKEAAAVVPFLDVVRRTKSRDRIVLASFSHRRMSAVRLALGPRVASSLSPKEVLGLRLAADGRTDRWLPRWAACAQVPETFGGRLIVDQDFVDLCHALGMQVHVWTVNDEPTMTRLLDYGVDGIMTDRPTLLKRVFSDRGVWRDPRAGEQDG